MRAASARLERLREGDGLLDGPAALGPVRARDAHRHGAVGWKGGADGIEHLERETHPVLEGTAIVVVTPVRQRREELVQQIAVSRMELNGVDAEPGGAPGRIGEGVPHPRQPVLIQCHGGGDLPANGIAEGATVCQPLGMIRRDLLHRLSRDLAGSLPPGVGQLDGDRHVGPAADALQHAPHGGLAFVRIEANIGVGDPPLGHDRRRLDGQERGARRARDGPDG